MVLTKVYTSSHFDMSGGVHVKVVGSFKHKQASCVLKKSTGIQPRGKYANLGFYPQKLDQRNEFVLLALRMTKMS